MCRHRELARSLDARAAPRFSLRATCAPSFRRKHRAMSELSAPHRGRAGYHARDKPCPCRHSPACEAEDIWCRSNRASLQRGADDSVTRQEASSCAIPKITKRLVLPFNTYLNTYVKMLLELSPSSASKIYRKNLYFCN